MIYIFARLATALLPVRDIIRPEMREHLGPGLLHPPAVQGGGGGGPAAEQREHGAPRGGRVRNSDAFPH